MSAVEIDFKKLDSAAYRAGDNRYAYDMRGRSRRLLSEPINK